MTSMGLFPRRTNQDAVQKPRQPSLGRPFFFGPGYNPGVALQLSPPTIAPPAAAREDADIGRAGAVPSSSRLANSTRSTPPSREFNYAKLAPAKRSQALKSAKIIRDNMDRMLSAAMVIGRELLLVKAHLDFGQFTQWVEVEFPHGIRTAQRLMNEAERFGENYLHVAHLCQTTRYRLAAPSTSDRLVRRVIAASERGKSLDDKAVNDLIARERSANRDGELADDVGFDDESEHLSPAAKAAALALKGLDERDLRRIAECLEDSSPEDFFDAVRSEISRLLLDE